MENSKTEKLLEKIISELDIPDSSYEKAKDRYEDLYNWLIRPNSKCRTNAPDVYAQGSFRLGTVVRPLSPNDSYDLDLGCRLTQGISKYTHSQKQLKELIGDEMELYRIAKQIEEPLDEKKRCWRLEYADQMSFHMDCVPSIPEEETKKKMLSEAIFNRESIASDLNKNITAMAGAITDNTRDDYKAISRNWLVSNSRGYALWFESRSQLAEALLFNRALSLGKSKIEQLPTHQWKSPLQRTIQILRRHRDVRYKENKDRAPISIIITTLAARAYRGQSSLRDSIIGVLNEMESHIRHEKPYVPNPVNPKEEDFADNWSTEEGRRLKLREEFESWIREARRFFKALFESNDAESVTENLNIGLGIRFGQESLARELGLPTSASHSNSISFNIITTPAKPWFRI